MMMFFLYSVLASSFAQESSPTSFRTPCFDGWAECFIEEEIRGSGFIYDHNQIRHDVHARVSFLDFSPLPEKLTILYSFPQDEEKIKTYTTKRYTKTKTVKTVTEVITKTEVITETKVKTHQEEWNCKPVDELEDLALMGQLSAGEIACLEDSLHKQSRMTQKVRISKILINNMQQSKKYSKWEQLVLRHLEKFDRSDANMSLGFAIYLANKGKYIDAIRWCDNAIEQSHTFAKGSDTTEKRYQAYRVRAISANKLWRKYSEDLVKYRDDLKRDRIEKKVKTYKAKTKNFSREWLDYARASSSSTTQALTLCIAASNRDFCK